MALVKTVNFYDFTHELNQNANINSNQNHTTGGIQYTNLTEIQSTNNNTSNTVVRWLLNSNTSSKNLLDFASYGKNKYDYIIITFDVWLDTSITTRTAEVFLQDVKSGGNYVVSSTYIAKFDNNTKHHKVNVILNNNTILAASANEIALAFRIFYDNTTLTEAESMYISECKMYVINRLRINNTTSGEIQDNGNSNITSKTSTNTLSGFDFSTEVIKVDPSQTSSAYQLYSIPSSNFSSGNPQTIFFNAYVDKDNITSDFIFTINDEVVKTISPRKIPECAPDFTFDFRRADGTDFYDSMGSGYYVDFQNSPSFSSSEGLIMNNGNALASSNTTGEYGTLKYSGSENVWDFGSNSFSFECVIKMYSTGLNNARIVTFFNQTGSNGNAVFLYVSGTTLKINLYKSGGAELTAVSTTITTNVSYHVSVVVDMDNGNVYLYVDGALADSATFTPSNFSTATGSRNYLWFGRSNSTNAAEYFDGSIAYFRMWSRPKNIFPIYYTSADSISSNIPLRIDISANTESTINSNDIIYIDRMINVAPTAANIFDGGLDVSNTMNVTGNIFNSNLIGEIAMFYQDSEIPPFGYLWCDGTEISTDDDEKYRTLIEILSDETRGSSSVDTTKSCYLPDYMFDTTGCHLLQADTTSPSNAPLYTNFNYNYKQNPAPSNNIAGSYTLDGDYFPSHNHTINDMGSTAGSGSQTLTHNQLVIESSGVYRFQHIDTHSGGTRGGDSPNSTQSHVHNHDIQPDNIAKTFVEDTGTAFQFKVSGITKNVDASFNADITLDNNGSGPTTNTTHIPVSFKVKYAIKYL